MALFSDLHDQISQQVIDRHFHNSVRTGIAGCSREIQDANITTGILATSTRLALKLKIVLNNVETPVAVVSALFQICDGSKVVEAF